MKQAYRLAATLLLLSSFSLFAGTLPAGLSTDAQPRTVTGTVTDAETNESLIGVNTSACRMVAYWVVPSILAPTD